MKKATAVVLVSLVAFACNGGGNGNGDATGPSQVFEGTFTLTSVTATEQGATVTLTPPAATGTLVVRPDNTYTITSNVPSVGIVNETSSGSWTRDGDTLTATDDDGTVVTVLISGDQNTLTFTLVEEGVSATVTYARA